MDVVWHKDYMNIKTQSSHNEYHNIGTHIEYYFKFATKPTHMCSTYMRCVCVCVMCVGADNARAYQTLANNGKSVMFLLYLRGVFRVHLLADGICM